MTTFIISTKKKRNTLLLLKLSKQFFTSKDLFTYAPVIISKVFGLIYTVVKLGHTEGIEREKTSSQKSNVIALQIEWQVVLALEGIALKSKVPRTIPSN